MRTAELDGKSYFFELGRWVDLYGNEVSFDVALTLYDIYLDDLFLHYLQEASSKPFDDVKSFAEQFYDELEANRKNKRKPRNSASNDYYFRLLSLKAAAYYQHLYGLIKTDNLLVSDEVKKLVSRLSACYRSLPKPELCEPLLFDVRERFSYAVDCELLASVIGSFSDLFNKSGFTDVSFLKKGIFYFAESMSLSSFRPPLTVRRAVDRLYKFALNDAFYDADDDIQQFIDFIRSRKDAGLWDVGYF